MEQPVPLPPPGFDDLPIEQQIDYVQSLWDRIAAHPDEIPVPDWHRQILSERVRDLEANPNQGEEWATVRDRIRARLGKPHS